MKVIAPLDRKNLTMHKYALRAVSSLLSCIGISRVSNFTRFGEYNVSVSVCVSV